MILQRTDSLEFEQPSELDSISDVSERVILQCRLAKEFESGGDYDEACNVLRDRWSRLGDRPTLDGLSPVAQADLVLRVGVLSGWMGRTKQIEGAQEIAKDLISEGARAFESLGLGDRAADAQVDLGVCYWREGALDEARVTLRAVLAQVATGQGEPRLRALAHLAVLEASARRDEIALQIQMEAAPLFEQSKNHALRGNFHNSFAIVLKNLGAAKGRTDYIDRAFIEFAAASYHWEQAGHRRYQALVENNLAMLYLTADRLTEAAEHGELARSIFVALKDKGSIAQVDETRARVFLAQGRNAEAEKALRGAVATLEEGDEKALLAEALTTHGIALARLGRNEDALLALSNAHTTADQAGDPESAGLAALTITEELGSFVPIGDRLGYYRKAESNLSVSQNPQIRSRLGECARRILAAQDYDGQSPTQTQPVPFLPKNGDRISESGMPGQELASSAGLMSCSLEDEVRRYEGSLIKRALETSGGSVTRAARLLGVTHQGLAFILNGRHKDLLSVRTPVKPRRRSIIRYR
jgi:tetratricopeptide (TPR) repeat protein